jgi:endonuclease/exonuclease/phosphatase family metal-dependent hydrolase/murein DD-endopeptidase MepM/ murein hydrolase activator NlpD
MDPATAKVVAQLLQSPAVKKAIVGFAAMTLAFVGVLAWILISIFNNMFGAGDPAAADGLTNPCSPSGDVVTAADIAKGGGEISSLQDDQRQNAATIVTVGHQLGVPTYGLVIALAAALQESGLRNLDYGDRDSLGLFQQRPSSGWGTPEQITNPVLATEAFFGRAAHTNNTGLLDIAGWESMPVTVAAQAVQRSAFPSAYAAQEPLARQILATLGEDPGVSMVDTTQCIQIAGDAVSYPLPADSGYYDNENYGEVSSIRSSWHTGTDLSVACGTPVLAATSGTVIVETDQAWSGPYLVKVSTGPGRLTTWYAHMRKIDVESGELVRSGQQLGEVGEEGNSTGCHLHFEVHPTGGTIYQDPVDPTPWLAEHVGQVLGIGNVPGQAENVVDPGNVQSPGFTGELTMLTYNIHVGADHGRSLPAIAREIKASGASVVVLNEIDAVSGQTPQATWLAKQLGMHAVYGPNKVWSGERERGNAILSRYPILDPSNTPLPMVAGTEPRGLLSAYVDVGDGNVVHVYASHLHFAGAVRLTQARAIASTIGEPTCTTFLLGDMNSTPQTSMYRALTQQLLDPYAGGRFGRGATVPASAPRARIDYTFHSQQAAVVTSQVMPEGASDHRAVRTTFAVDPDYSCQ